jgi:hypothetical protein
LSTRNGVSAAVAVRPADAHRGTLARWRWLLGVVAGGPGGGGWRQDLGVWRVAVELEPWLPSTSGH